MKKGTTTRQKLLGLVDEWEALLTFTHDITKEERKTVDTLRINIKGCNKSKLKIHRENLESDIYRDKQRIGFYGSRPKLLKFYKDVVKASKKGNMLYASKSFILSLSKKYDVVLPSFSDLPYHTLVGFSSIVKKDKKGWGDAEIKLLERDIYDEMCILCNMALENGSRNKQKLSRRKAKIVRALERSTIRAAFAFMEAYVNGLYDDYLLRNGINRSEEGERKDERIEKKPLYYKIGRYQRTLLDVTQEPIKTDNCQELEYLFGESKDSKGAKDSRDAFTHPSAYGGKYDIIFRYSEYEMDKIVDAAISLTLELQKALYGNTTGTPWLKKRERDGLFRVSSRF